MNTIFGAPMDSVMLGLLITFSLVTAVVAALAIKNPLLFKLGIRNLPRRRAQTTLIIVGLMLSTVIITSALGAGDTFSYSIRVNSVASLSTVDEAVSPRVGAGTTLHTGNAPFSVAAPAVAFFPASTGDRVARSLAAGKAADGVLGAIVETVSVQDLTSRQTVATTELAAIPTTYPAAFGSLRNAQGAVLAVNDLGPSQVYLNARAAKVLDAHAGDVVRLFLHDHPVQATVRAIARDEGLAAGGLISSGVRVDPTIVLPLKRAQALVGHPGQITTLLISNTGDELTGATRTSVVANTIRAALTRPAALASAVTFVGSSRGLAAVHALLVDSSVSDAARGKLRALLAAVAHRDNTALAAVISDPDLVSALRTIKDATISAPLNTALAGLSDFTVQTLKQDALDAADAGGNSATSFFLLFGLFSIASGTMLIFLIFVMLAAERRAEMGMARAIGTKRRHLIQQFLFEGYAYDLGAALIGLALGIVVSLGLVAMMAEIFNQDNFTVQRHFEPRSLVVSFCLGALVTFITVASSSWRVSRLNIVAAIRDLADDKQRAQSLGAALKQSIANVGGLRHGRKRLLVVAVAAFLLYMESGGPGGPIAGAVLLLLWSFRPLIRGLIARGPLLVVDGVALSLVGLSSKEEFPFKLGVSLVLIGIAMLARWIMACLHVSDRARNRFGYSLAGISLVAFWSLPFDALQALGVPVLQGSIEMFFLSGMMLVLGGIWTLMYNLDVLMGALLRGAGGLGRIAPVLKMAVTYPTQYRFRTGMAMAMFSLILFTLMVVSVLASSLGGVRLDTKRFLGGYDLWGTTSAGNPAGDMRGRIAANPTLRGDIAAVGGLARIGGDLRQAGQADQSWQPYIVNVADNSYLDSVAPAFLHSRAHGYASDSQVWRALRTHPGYAVVDDWLVKRKNGDSTGAASSFSISGLLYDDKTFKPVAISMRDARTGAIIPLTVIGVLDQAGAANSDSFARITRGVYVGQTTLTAARDLPATANTYFFSVRGGANVHQTALALGSALLNNGLDVKEAKAEFDAGQAANTGFFNMLRGFLGLGLVVGIAALGVIASRSVVERRQQIGMLRAIGFRRRMVRTVFLLESSFVAVFGTLLGVVLGLVLAHQLVNSFAKDDSTLHVVVPWLQVGLIAVAAYAASLLTTYLPAWHASRVYPAEALRYE